MALTVTSGDAKGTETTRKGEHFSDEKGLLGGFIRTSDNVSTAIVLISPDGTIRYLTVDNSNTVSASATRP